MTKVEVSITGLPFLPIPPRQGMAALVVAAAWADLVVLAWAGLAALA
jgi:hypothetical protein